MDEFSTGVKSAIIASLSEYVNNIESITSIHNPILIALSCQGDRAAAEPRNLLLKMISVLGTVVFRRTT